MGTAGGLLELYLKVRPSHKRPEQAEEWVAGVRGQRSGNLWLWLLENWDFPLALSWGSGRAEKSWLSGTPPAMVADIPSPFPFPFFFIFFELLFHVA